MIHARILIQRSQVTIEAGEEDNLIVNSPAIEIIELVTEKLSSSLFWSVIHATDFIDCST